MKTPSQVPVMTLPNVILFPQAMLPLYIFEPRYRRMVRDVLEGDRVFAVAMQRSPGRRETPARVAGLGLVRACVTHADGTSHLVLMGLQRVHLTRTRRYRPYRVCEVAFLPQEAGSEIAVHALSVRLIELVRQRLAALPETSFVEFAGPEAVAREARSMAVEAFQKLIDQLHSVSDPEQVADLISATLLPDPADRQLILQTPGVEGRLRHLVRIIGRQVKGQNSQDT
ncbi:MAG: LON peptidase substrate-binding domain-containing protein [Verrucomicrobiales bacterium]|nr:LON peptidase substrate-binding domain-containing protein [Verrucomicrobiales bacterium]MCP5526495.1 LON peptidase substrate-binding domain-containing protein [Verrucomicrobiales bacterium]